MQLTCKTCGKPIPSENVNIDKAIAKCQVCHAVFSFLHQVRGEQVRPRPKVELPARMRMENWGPELVITRSWYTHALWFMILFCMFWDGFLIVWYTVGIGAMLSGKGEPGIWIMLVFPVLHVAVGVGVTYATMCGFVNRSVIRISMGELTVRHGPLPCFGNRQLFTSDLKQLYCTESIHRGKNGCRTTYNVIALTRDGGKVTLLSNLDQLDQALYVEQQVEQHLRIPDERVAEEVRV